MITSAADDVVAGLSLEETRSVLDLLLEHASPTGFEAELATAIAAFAQRNGIAAAVDNGPGCSASVVLTVPGRDPAAPSTLLYAPIDTLSGPDATHFAPWFGTAESLRRSGTPHSGDGWVGGEGAENPKGYATAALMAGLTLSRASSRPPGDVRIALCGGSVPTSGTGDSSTLGFGTGVLRLLQRGLTADAAVACKPGWWVAHEEVGLIWCRLLLWGRGAYVGFRHISPYRNPIPVAGRVATALEQWFERYAAEEASGSVAPQGAVTGIRSGVPAVSAFVGNACELRLDMRVSPRRSLASAVRLVRDAVKDALADDPDIGWELTTVGSVPPTCTSEQAAVVRAARAAWERVAGVAHPVGGAASGASDTNLLRAWGIPTARVGMPLGEAPPAVHNDSFAMNAVDPAACVQLSELLVRTALSIGASDETVIEHA